MEHVAACAACARFAQEQRKLSAALAALAQEDVPDPEEFAAPVMAEFDRVRPGQSQAWRWILAVGVAAAIALAVVRSGVPEPAPTQDERPFVAIPYTVPLAPDEHPLVARIEIPVPALIAAGFRVTADPAGVVEADVLVGEDGRVRAIRIRE